MAILEQELGVDAPEEDALPEERPDVGDDAMPEDLKPVLRSLVRKFEDQEGYARQTEVGTVWKRRMMRRGFANAVCDYQNANFQVSPAPNVGLTTAGLESETAVRAPIVRSYNVYLARERTWAAAFSQTPPGVRFQPEDPEDPQDIAGAEAANVMRRIIEKFNPPRKLAQKAANLSWSDGRVIAWTRFVRDAQRFGVDGDGEPMGREVVSLFGVLESKVPITCADFSEYPYLFLEWEQDLSMIKAEYPESAQEIGDAGSASKAELYARNARITSAEGARMGLGSDNASFLGTVQHCWLRPEAFWAVDSQDMRERLLERYPDGCHVVYVGEVMCAESNESMDAHLSVFHALEGDGQARPSVGAPMVDPQRVVNELMGLAEESFRYVIPMTLIDDNLLDADAIQEMEAAPGAFVPVEKNPQVAIEDCVHDTGSAQIPPEMMAMLEQLVGPLSDMLSSTPQVLAGAPMPDQKTAHGYALARDQALGVIGLTWQPYCDFYARIMGQAVRIAGKTRQAGRLSAVVAAASGNPGRTERVTLDVGTLRGNFTCYPETDANFPEGYTARSNKIVNLLNNAGQNPALAPLLAQPDNQALIIDAIGVPGIVDPAKQARDKQLAEIQEMKSQPPIPNPAFAQWQAAAAIAQQNGAPAPGSAPPPLLSSIPIDPDWDDNAAEAAEIARWLNSATGQEAKRSNPEWFTNCRLHGMAHKAAEARQAAQNAPAPKPPGTSMTLKDVAALNPQAGENMIAAAGYAAPAAPAAPAA